MARLARLVIPDLPHHVTQRGNRRQQTFFDDGDYAAYLELMSEWCREEGVEIWAYCLMQYSGDTILVLIKWAVCFSLRAWQDWHGWSFLVCRIM